MISKAFNNCKERARLFDGDLTKEDALTIMKMEYGSDKLVAELRANQTTVNVIILLRESGSDVDIKPIKKMVEDFYNEYNEVD